MNVNIKKLHKNAVIPSYAKPGDAALDLTSTGYTFDRVHNFYEYRTGLAFEIPEGYVGLLFPRSSLSNKSFHLCNSVGVLDSGYRGEVTFRFRPTQEYPHIYDIGDKIGQIIILPYPKITLVEVQDLNDTARGTGGYGSTGK